jgi:CBS domain-containing protein
MNVDQYMQPGVTTLPPDSPLSAVRDTMDAHGFGLLLIATSEGVLTGFITRAGLKDVKDWDAAVEKFSHPVKFSVAPGDTLEKAALIMLANRLVVLPVVQEERLIGVITQAELLKGLTLGLGIGREATRFTAKVRNGSDDVYHVLAVLNLSVSYRGRPVTRILRSSCAFRESKIRPSCALIWKWLCTIHKLHEGAGDLYFST